MWLDDRYMMSFKGNSKYHIFIVIGARGVGKTFKAKSRAINWFYEKGEKFVWCRNTEAMIDSLKENEGSTFIADLKEKHFLKKINWNLKISGDNTITFCEDDFIKTEETKDNPFYEHCGYLMPLSLFYKLKGRSYADIKNIFFDEFISEEGEVIRGNRVKQFLNTIETIGRLRTDYNIFMMSNALDKGDPILNLFFDGDKIKDYGYYFNEEKGAILLYSDNSPEFNEARALSISGRILKGTIYEDNIAHNKFKTFDSMYFTEKPKGLVFLLVLCTELYKMSLYCDDKLFYVTKYNNQTTKKFYSRDNKSKLDKGKVLNRGFLNKLREAYSNNLIMFDGEVSRKYFVEFIK